MKNKSRKLVNPHPFQPFSFWLSEVSHAWNTLLLSPEHKYVGLDKNHISIIDLRELKNEDIVLYRFNTCFTVHKMGIDPIFLKQLLSGEHGHINLSKFMTDYHLWGDVNVLGSIYAGDYYNAVKSYYRLIGKQNKRLVPHWKDIKPMTKQLAKDEKDLLDIPNSLKDMPGYITGKLSVMSNICYHYEYDLFEDYFDWGMPEELTPTIEAVPSVAWLPSQSNTKQNVSTK